jgi:DNA-directed RNA polymerase specialized sigma24 family protein
MLTTMSATPTSELEFSPTPAHIADVLVATSRSFATYLENEVGSRAICDEILQDAFGRGTRNIGVLNSHESAVDWVYRLLRNAVIDQPRSRGSSEPKFSAFRGQLEQELEPRVALKDAILRYIGGLCAILEPEHAAALRSVELGGASVAAFAEATGISVRLASVRVSEARAALRRGVVTSAGICPSHGRWNCTCGLGFVAYGQARTR